MGPATNPILDEINGLSPGAKTALISAHTATSGVPPAQPAPDPGLQAPSRIPKTPVMDAPPPAPPTLGLGGPPPTLGAPPTPNVTAPRGTLEGDEAERSRLLSTGSGISQIHSKIENSGFGQAHPMLGKILGWGAEIPARAAEIGGSMLGPTAIAERFTPGTQIHHNLEVGNLNSTIANESKVGLEGAQADEAKARATSLENPPDRFSALPTDQGYQSFDQHSGKTTPITDASGQPEHPYEKPGPAEHVVVAGPDGKPVFANYQGGKFLDAQGQEIPNARPYEKPDPTGNDFEQYYKDYLTDNRLPDSAHNRQLARKDWAAASQAPQRAPVVNVLIPDGKGGYVDQGIHPGSTVAPGAVTPSGMNSMNTPTAQTRNMAEMAQTVLPQMKTVSDEVDQMSSALGPAVGRWNQYMINKGGKDFPQFAKLDTDLDLLASAIVRTHFGARGGQGYREELRKQFGEAQSPEDLKARIAGANQWIEGYAHMADRGGNGGGDGNAPKEGETKTNSAGDKIIFKGGKWGPA